MHQLGLSQSNESRSDIVHGRPLAQTFYAEKSHLDFSRAAVRNVTVTGNQRLVVCFDREGLGQTGTGHYSPIAAYDGEADVALVLDVSRFTLSTG